MSIDNDDVDDAGAGIIEFGLAKKSVDVLRNHMNALNNMEKSIKAMVQPGSGGAFSGKFLQVAQQQLLYTKDIAAGIRQLNIQLTKGAGLQRQMQQLAVIEFRKNMGKWIKNSDIKPYHHKVQHQSHESYIHYH